MISIANGPSWSDQATAIATCVMAVATIVVGVFAVVQVRLARLQREDQLRPYVYIDFEVDDRHNITLRLQNVGQTAATSVSFECDPPLASFSDRTAGGTRKPSDFITNTWPTLPPGKIVTSWFDHMPERLSDPGLPSRYEVAATYTAPAIREGPSWRKNRPAKSIVDHFILDLDAYRGRMYPQARDLRSMVQETEKVRRASEDQAQALRDIARLVERILDPPDESEK